MAYTRTEAMDRLLQACCRYYTVTRFDGSPSPVPDEEGWPREAGRIAPPTGDSGAVLTAVGEYYERTGQHLLLRQNEIWAARQEEFLFLFSVTELTPERFAACRDFAYSAGMSMAHIGPEHMYTYISPLFVCDSVHEEARRQLEHCRIYKTFRFSFRGWLDFHAACYDASRGTLSYNKAGTCMRESLERILFPEKKERKGLSRFFS
ncbi:MAG: hypothetical protein ACOYKB_06660 [Succiniclasticum sp.]|jgi:hypothetical protein